MKKLLAISILGLIAFHSNISSMEEKQDIKKQTKFTKMDWIKLGAASLGCAWFGTAAGMTYPALKQIDLPDILCIPGGFSFLATRSVTKHLFSKDVLPENKINRDITIAGIFSAALCCGLAGYVLKKIIQLKKSTEFDQAKEQLNIDK